MKPPFHVVFAKDFYEADGKPKFHDFGMGLLQQHKETPPRVLETYTPELQAEHLGDANGVVILTQLVTRHSVRIHDQLLAIGRFGVGYDSIDVEACTDADVLLFIATGAVDRSVAEATLMWMLTLSHHTFAKDQMVRKADWGARAKLMGTELRRRTLGIVGFGGIGRALAQLVHGFGMKRIVAFDPHVERRSAEQHGVDLVTLEELMEQSDFVSIHCPLTPTTRNLIGDHELAWMKPTAYLINTARGGIVNEAALYRFLKDRRIAGAAIDVFETEPIVTPPPLAELDNVLLAPHCIAWTDELFADVGKSIAQGMIDLAHGERPRGVVNPNVFKHPGFRRKWERWGGK